MAQRKAACYAAFDEITSLSIHQLLSYADMEGAGMFSLTEMSYLTYYVSSDHLVKKSLEEW